MKLIIIDISNHILFDHDNETLSNDDIEIIESLNERETVSYSVIFKENVKLKQTHDFNQLMKHPEIIQEVIVTVK